MRKKQLFALLMAGALSVGMAPTATFAADTAAETSAEGELEGELDSADTEEPSEDPAETPEEPAEDPTETPEDPAETPAETTADPTEAPAAEETDEQAAEAGSADQYCRFSGPGCRTDQNISVPQPYNLLLLLCPLYAHLILPPCQMLSIIPHQRSFSVCGIHILTACGQIRIPSYTDNKYTHSFFRAHREKPLHLPPE